MTNAFAIDYGIEFETTMPTSDNTPIGPRHAGYPVSWLPAGWKVEKDASIHSAPGRKGAEFVSPKLRGLDGLEQLKTACHEISARGGEVNASCGLHVTVTFPHTDAPALARLLCLVANFEKAIYASTGTKSREQGRYCKSIKANGSLSQADRRAKSDRYHLLNLTHLAMGRNRIEFRCFAGTLNATKVLGYVMLVLGLVELALNATRQAEWNYEKPAGLGKSAWDRAGALPGETDLTRLFYKLGWIKGHSKRVWGSLVGGVEELRSIKKKLIELAKKYDQNS